MWFSSLSFLTYVSVNATLSGSGHNVQLNPRSPVQISNLRSWHLQYLLNNTLYRFTSKHSLTTNCMKLLLFLRAHYFRKHIQTQHNGNYQSKQQIPSVEINQCTEHTKSFDQKSSVWIKYHQIHTWNHTWAPDAALMSLSTVHLTYKIEKRKEKKNQHPQHQNPNALARSQSLHHATPHQKIREKPIMTHHTHIPPLHIYTHKWQMGSQIQSARNPQPKNQILVQDQ